MAAQSRPPHRAPAILLTRPIAQSLRFAQTLRDRFGSELSIVISPLMETRFLEPALPVQPWEALILTSETAAKFMQRISAQNKWMPERAFCVGDRTALVAAEAGLKTMSAQGDANALYDLILAQKVMGPLLHLRGEESRGDLAKRLVSAGLETFEAVIYRQIPQPMTVEAITLLTGKDPVLVPLFSPRSAELFDDEFRRIGGQAFVIVAALSRAVAMAFSGNLVNVATQPDAAAVVEILAKHIPDSGTA